MTVQEIVQKVCERKKVSRAQIYNYFKVLNIEPLGARQKPQRYPEDSADKVLQHLGLPHVVTMPQLKAARRNSRRGTR